MRSARGFWGMVQERGSWESCSSWTALHAQSTSVLSSGFPLSQGNAEALDRWGRKTKQRLIPYFLSNTSAKTYRNRIVYVKITANQMWGVFETRCIPIGLLSHTIIAQLMLGGCQESHWGTKIMKGKKFVMRFSYIVWPSAVKFGAMRGIGA